MVKLDIRKFKQRAYRKKRDLARFLRRTGKSTGRGLLKTVKEVDNKVWQQIDCKSCANCCKTMTPTYTRSDVSRLARHFNMSYKQFFDKWLKLDDNKDIINQSTPCQFLGKDDKCTIYDIRPTDCAEFPHFGRRDFRYQAVEDTYTNNLKHCPATLVFVEKLKAAIEADL